MPALADGSTRAVASRRSVETIKNFVHIDGTRRIPWNAKLQVASGPVVHRRRRALVFLVLGMLAAEDRPGRIRLNDYPVTLSSAASPWR